MITTKTHKQEQKEKKIKTKTHPHIQSTRIVSKNIFIFRREKEKGAKKGRKEGMERGRKEGKERNFGLFQTE